jgi:hypothetical protein
VTLGAVPRRAILAAAALVLAQAACGPKIVHERVYETERVTVELRRSLERGEPVPRGYEHPAAIPGVRFAHILAAIAHETKPGEQEPTIRSECVYEIADGLAAAFAKAGPDDEVVALARMHDQRFKVFSVERVTAFRSWIREGQLWLDFFEIERELEKEERDAGYQVPYEPLLRAPEWRLVPASGLAVSSARRVAVDWRAERWGRAGDLRVQRGKLRRRTILMDSGEGVEPVAPPPHASDAQRRALDALDAARRAGLVSEAEFQRRRRLVLEGRLAEAGYAEEPSAAPDSGIREPRDLSP